MIALHKQMISALPLQLVWQQNFTKLNAEASKISSPLLCRSSQCRRCTAAQGVGRSPEWWPPDEDFSQAGGQIWGQMRKYAWTPKEDFFPVGRRTMWAGWVGGSSMLMNRQENQGKNCKRQKRQRWLFPDKMFSLVTGDWWIGRACRRSPGQCRGPRPPFSSPPGSAPSPPQARSPSQSPVGNKEWIPTSEASLT